MKVALHNADKTRFPNIALMKISRYHKDRGDEVTEYMPLLAQSYDKIYASKVFTFTKTEKLIGNVIYGGTGYDLKTKLPKEIDDMCPDYPPEFDRSYGFTTRGCIRNCKWCLVPEKEGKIKPYQDIDVFTRHNKIVLMDNNILAHQFGISQIEKISKKGLYVDFNQGIDSRLIDSGVAKLLAKTKMIKVLRLACDSKESMQHLEKAVKILRWNNVTPRRYFVYCLVQDVDEDIGRIKFIKYLNLDPYAQPFRDFKTNKKPSRELKEFAQWINDKSTFYNTTWNEHKKTLTF